MKHKLIIVDHELIFLTYLLLPTDLDFCAVSNFPSRNETFCLLYLDLNILL